MKKQCYVLYSLPFPNQEQYKEWWEGAFVHGVFNTRSDAVRYLKQEIIEGDLQQKMSDYNFGISEDLFFVWYDKAEIGWRFVLTSPHPILKWNKDKKIWSST